MARFTLPVSVLEGLPLMQRIVVPDDYLDMMGHMNIRWYMTIFADAARELTASFGITAEYVEDERKGAFMLRHFNQYMAEVRGGETLAVRSRLLSRSEKRVHYINFMVNESRDNLAATMEIVTAHADLTARRTAPFPADIAGRIDALLAEHEQLEWEAPLAGVLRA